MDSDASIDHMAEEISSEMPIKLTRNIGKNVLHSFNKLACPLEKDRLEAGVSILKHLADKQEESQDNEICNELKYAVRRLVRGVGTSRLDARNGFYSTFVALLSTFPQITTAKVMEFVAKELASTEKPTKSEKGEELTGQVLVYGALIQSGVLLKATEEEQHEVLSNLLNCAGSRSYLPVIAYSFLKDLMDRVDVTFFKKQVWPVMDPVVGLPLSQQTLDTFYFLLTARRTFPSVVNNAYLCEHLGTPGLVCEESLPQCCQMLMSIPRRICLLHPVFEEFSQWVLAEGLLVHLWENVLDPHLTMSSNKTKELVVAQIFQHILTHVANKEQIACMLRPALVGLLLRPGPKKRANRDEASIKFEQCTEQLVKTLHEANDKAVRACIDKILFYKGHFHMEQGTGYALIRQLTAQLNTAAGVKKLTKVYQKVVEEKSPTVTDPDRVAAAQLYARLIGHPAVQADIEWKAKRLHTLLHIGLFATEGGVAQPAAIQIKECFYKALDQKAANLDALRNLLIKVVFRLNTAISDESLRAALRQPLAAETMESWSHMTRVVRELDADSRMTLSAVPLFHIMFLHLGLQLFADQKMATEALKELHSCYERVVATKTTKKKKKKLKEGDLEDEEPEWVEVTVELLLSLLSNPSHLLRSIVMCVFPHLCPHLTPSAIQQILQVFDTKSGRSLLSAENDTDSSGSESDNEDDGSDSEESGSSGGEEDLFDEEDGDGEKETVTDKLRLAVRQALGTAASLTDEESVDLDAISEGEGRRLDTALSSAFRLMREARTTANAKRPKQSKEDEAQMHFRSRALGLLEAVLAAEPSMATCLDLVVPLFELLEFCMRDAHQKPLENRTRACLKKLAGVKSWSSTAADVTEQQVADLLNSLLTRGERTAPVYLDMLEESSLCSVFLVRCSMHLGHSGSGERADLVRQHFEAALRDFVHKRECLLSASLFKNTLQLTWGGNWSLATLLVELAFSPDVRIYKRQQCLQLLRAFYVNHRQLRDPSHADTLAALSRQLVKNCTQLLTSQADEASPLLKATYLVELLSLLKHVLKSPNQSGTSKMWTKLGEVVTLLASSKALSAAVVSAVRSLASLLHLTVTHKKAIKEPNDEAEKKDDKKEKLNKIVANGNSSDSEVEATQVVKEKVKKRKTNFKLKKESKQLRLNAMSEGFENTNFSVKPEINIDRAVNGNSNGNKMLNGNKTKKRKLNIESTGKHVKKIK